MAFFLQELVLLGSALVLFGSMSALILWRESFKWRIACCSSCCVLLATVLGLHNSPATETTSAQVLPDEPQATPDLLMEEHHTEAPSFSSADEIKQFLASSDGKPTLVYFFSKMTEYQGMFG